MSWKWGYQLAPMSRRVNALYWAKNTRMASVGPHQCPIGIHRKKICEIHRLYVYGVHIVVSRNPLLSKSRVCCWSELYRLTKCGASGWSSENKTEERSATLPLSHHRQKVDVSITNSTNSTNSLYLLSSILGIEYIINSIWDFKVNPITIPFWFNGLHCNWKT